MPLKRLSVLESVTLPAPLLEPCQYPPASDARLFNRRVVYEPLWSTSFRVSLHHLIHHSFIPSPIILHNLNRAFLLLRRKKAFLILTFAIRRCDPIGPWPSHASILLSTQSCAGRRCHLIRYVSGRIRRNQAHVEIEKYYSSRTNLIFFLLFYEFLYGIRRF